MTIKAVYENGVFRPKEAVKLPEGSEVEVQLPQTNEQVRGGDPKETARWLAEIAKIPPSGTVPQDGLSGGRDHDKILYGGPKGAP